MINTTEIKVRGFHLDLYGHVNNTRYLEFLEDARWQIKENYLNFPESHEKGFGLTVVRNVINYRNLSKLGDILTIHSRVKEIRNKSAVFEHKIFLNKTDKLILDAEVTFVILDLKNEKAIPIKGEWLEMLQQLM